MEAATVSGRPAAAAPVRSPRSRPKPKAVPRPRPKAVPGSQASPARAPRKRRAPARRPGGQLIPLALGTATAVRSLPDSSLMVRLTRGRSWIGLLGVLLAGIVALNVVTLSLAASAGTIDQNIQALEEENSMLRARDAERSGVARVSHDAAAIGLAVPQVAQIHTIQATPGDAAVAARRLTAAGTG
ncbi:MAG: hypothetical protein ACHQCF_04925 [Solirubrobacterales bacterium]